MIGRSLNSRITGQARFSRKTKDAEDVMKMLIVEDQEKHLADAKATVKKLEQKFELEVRYAGTLEEAKKELDWAEVVVTDLFFPEKPGESPDPKEPPPDSLEEDIRACYAEYNMSGIKLAKLALAQKKPVVVCTSTHHHGEKTQPACDWVRGQKMNLVDNIVGDDREGEAPTKAWKQALVLAIALHGAPKQKTGTYIFDLYNRCLGQCLKRGGKMPKKLPDEHIGRILRRYLETSKGA